MGFLSKPINFIKEVRLELGKVAWSTRQELFGSTMVVIVTTAILALFITLIDVVLSKGVNFLFRT